MGTFEIYAVPVCGCDKDWQLIDTVEAARISDVLPQISTGSDFQLVAITTTGEIIPVAPTLTQDGLTS